jgi:tetratricopeptide (TPR) repeat protein
MKGADRKMARKTYGKEVAKLIAGIVLLIATIVGLSYGSLLRGMEDAADAYNKGDNETALKRYESVEARLRSLGVIRIIPAKDRRNLFLNEARLLYALGRFDDAGERLQKEAEIAGASVDDGRFKLLQGEIAFRKAVKNYRESPKKDPRVLEEALRGSEDSLRESLRQIPDDWDAKYNFEYVNYIRNLMNQDDQGKMKILMENVRIKEMKPQALPPDQQM